MTPVNSAHIELVECNDPLVDLAGYNFVLQPEYFAQGFSKDNRMFLRKLVAEKLATIQRELLPYRFKIWDGWRPRAVQSMIYEKYWQELKAEHPDWNADQLRAQVATFVAHPNDSNQIPPHATGGAVDLTLVDKFGMELDMGTAFDHFGPEAASLFYEEISRSENIRCNRQILREAMLAHEFQPDPYEWWHYDYGNHIWAAAYNNGRAIFAEIDLPHIAP